MIISCYHWVLCVKDRNVHNCEKQNTVYENTYHVCSWEVENTEVTLIAVIVSKLGK